MKKLFDDVKISEQEISDIIVNDIIKREIIDSEESKKAKKDIEKLYKKIERTREKNNVTSPKNTPGPVQDAKDENGIAEEALTEKNEE